MKNKILILGALITILALLVVPVTSSMSEADTDQYQVLIDLGNGKTYWSSANETQTLDEAFIEAFSDQDMTFSSSGNTITVDGKTTTKISSITTSWRYYVWSGTDWTDTTYNGSSLCADKIIAVGFYPAGTAPAATPDNPYVRTMVMCDSENSGNQTNMSDTVEEAKLVSTHDLSVYTSILSAGDNVYFLGSNYPDTDAFLCCFDRVTGNEVWSVELDAEYTYQLATGAIVGDYVYFSVSYGSFSSYSNNYSHIYGVPLSGPGENNKYVIDFDVDTAECADMHTTSSKVMFGPSSLIYDSGALYFATSSGYVYCLSLDLKLQWKTSIQAPVYPSMAATISDGLLFIGAYDGCLYMLDSVTGEIKDSIEIYFDGKSGGVSVPAVFDDTIIVTYTDGMGMNMQYCGTAVLGFDRSTTQFIGDSLSKTTQWGRTSNYLVKSETEDFTGVYSTSTDATIISISTDGVKKTICDDNGIGEIHGSLILVNGSEFYFNEYNIRGSVYKVSITGKVMGEFERPISIIDYAMTNVTVIGNFIYATSDSGMFIVQGTIDSPEVPASSGSNMWYAVLVVIIIVVAVFALYCFRIRKTHEAPIVPSIIGKIKNSSGFNNERISKTKKNKRRLLIVCVIGVIITFAMFLCCLSFGPSGTLSLSEALSSLVSAIGKHGQDLTFNELIVYESRLPRAIAALGVGIGLSVAGCVYQAIIRNPMVDPYIMGVSSGAGTFAVAAIAAGFTFFGLFPTGSVFGTPILAIIGGLLAFILTMFLAEKAGGSSTTYVLSGVIVGMVFTSIQTIILTTSGSDKLHSAISWLYGSFANIGWDTVWLIFIPALFLSLIPLIWAKELNLVLLGEDQAKQMGLNVRRFNRMALILASVLTAVCVAFCGIIGFVGLVIPHLCRMVLGGDHRLVLPASIVIGGALMLFADLLARMIMIPQELPVGAITTIIGVPVFAYLLIKKGRMYDG